MRTMTALVHDSTCENRDLLYKSAVKTCCRRQYCVIQYTQWWSVVTWNVSASVNEVDKIKQIRKLKHNTSREGAGWVFVQFVSYSSEGNKRWLYYALIWQRKIDPIISRWWWQRSVSGSTVVSQISTGVVPENKLYFKLSKVCDIICDNGGKYILYFQMRTILSSRAQ